MLIRDLNMMETVRLYFPGKMLLHFVLAVNQKYGFYQCWILAGQEMEEVVIIAVGAHGFD